MLYSVGVCVCVYPLPGGHVHLTHERHPSLLLRFDHLHSVAHEGHGHLALSPLAIVFGALAGGVDCLEGLLFDRLSASNRY
jgi:hypothetical protein